MTKRIFRSISEPIREGLSWEQRWKGPDNGLITCWEVGREIGRKNPGIAEKAKSGGLPGGLGWKGGLEKEIKNERKYGSMFYLAQWQGIRGDDLEIYPEEDISITCSKTGVTVIFTPRLVEIERKAGKK